MAKLNYSRQREAILDFLCHTTSHPTAEEVYMYIRDIYPNISLGTVYRNLALLVEHGQALKIQGEDCDHFDGNTRLHYHFLCDSCHHVYDVEMEPATFLLKNTKAGIPGKVRGHSVIFYGTCDNCLNNEKTQKILINSTLPIHVLLTLQTNMSGHTEYWQKKIEYP